MFNMSWILPTKFSRPVFGKNMYNKLANHIKHLKLVLYSTLRDTRPTEPKQHKQPKLTLSTFTSTQMYNMPLFRQSNAPASWFISAFSFWLYCKPAITPE